jgi:serine/threonine protein kinase
MYDNHFCSKTIHQIGLRLVEIMEKIHLAGYTYNDLKLDNILVGNHSNSEKYMHHIRVVDFGFSAKF